MKFHLEPLKNPQIFGDQAEFMARGRHLVAGRFAHPGPSTGVSTCMGKLYRFWILDERLYYVDLFQGLRVCNTDRRGALWIKGLCFFSGPHGMGFAQGVLDFIGIV